MKKHASQRMVSLLAAFVLVASLVPATAMAEETSAAAAASSDVAAATEEPPVTSAASEEAPALQAPQEQPMAPESTLQPAGDATVGNSADWPNFRGNEENNGVVDIVTPIDPSETELLWSYLGGTSWSDAPSFQIIVNNSLVAMVGTALLRLDLQTGAVLAKGEMVGAPSFGNTAPTYGGGMIFCALGSGRIQAFDATTLQSLWVYRDPLKGQAQCPITYSDGYVYTGFWNSEKKDANYVCIKAEDEDPTTGLEEKTAVWSSTNAGGYYWAGSVAVGKYLVYGTEDGTTALDGTSRLFSVDKTTGAAVSCLELSGLGDQRSTICYDPSSGRLFFTTKNGYICSVTIDAATGKLSGLKSHQVLAGAQSTSTPVYYKGYLYFGVGAGYSGGDNCRFVCADASSLQTVFSLTLPGYPQCSMLLTTAYESTGYLYFYTTYNAPPGGIYLVKVKNNPQSAADAQLMQLYDAAGFEQYCLSSLICGPDGTLYYKNDSCRILAVGFSETAQQIRNDRNLVKEFTDAVAALPNGVTLEDEANVVKAQGLLDVLSAEQRGMVSPAVLAKLQKANADIALLKAIQKEEGEGGKGDDPQGDTPSASGATHGGVTVTTGVATQKDGKVEGAEDEDDSQRAYTAKLPGTLVQTAAAATTGASKQLQTEDSFPWIWVLIAGGGLLLLGLGLRLRSSDNEE